MYTASRESDRFILPDRMRRKSGNRSDLAVRMALGDRIAELSDIETIDSDDDLAPRCVDIYFRQTPLRRSLRQKPGFLLLRLCSDGLTVHGLSRWERHQVLVHGWGKLVAENVLVHFPRDNDELEIVWRIFERAYDRISRLLATPVKVPAISVWDLPKFSRTSLH